MAGKTVIEQHVCTPPPIDGVATIIVKGKPEDVIHCQHCGRVKWNDQWVFPSEIGQGSKGDNRPKARKRGR